MRSHTKITEATRELIGTRGFDAVTIAAVADRAGVSRQTVYSNFGTREEMVSRALAEHMGSLVAGFPDLLATAESPVAFVVDLIVECRRAFRTDAILGALLRSQAGNPLFDPGAADRAVEVSAGFLVPMQERFPEVEGRLEEIAEIAVHLGWAVVCLDDPVARPDDVLRAFLERWLTPALSV
ncbi:MAG: TetR/AcrR family transcriptional regulator [Rhodococcus sp.]|uniref:TetR/AcrR family transcriptional regulator n=1 Tax=Rhodococcus TaxID=1827 RepID=UPI0016A69172|nr:MULTISPECIES: TetR/AcrR family transcriptional regulator [Rhodococcus]NLV79625.1 TetR/AcrR family transcriptional regulator [Rhodococcus sp. (in: high G+C Gram-positive bacteria)]